MRKGLLKICVAVTIVAGLAFAAHAALSPDTAVGVSGGGTILAAPTYPSTVASFGFNAERPDGFTGGGTATGRINYDIHSKTAARHLSVSVVAMLAELSATPGPNGTGGRAVLIGDCTATGASCPPGIASVVLYVED